MGLCMGAWELTVCCIRDMSIHIICNCYGKLINVQSLLAAHLKTHLELLQYRQRHRCIKAEYCVGLRLGVIYWYFGMQ